MPAAIAVALSTVVVGTITVGQIVFAVASFAISSAMANRAQKKAEAAQRAAAEQQRAAFNAGLVDRTTVIRSAIQPRNIVLGRDEVSGPLVCWFTYGPLRNYHAFAVVLAGHECDAIETVMFNHEPVTLDGSGAVIAPAKYTRTISNTYTESFGEGVPVVLSRTPTRIDSNTTIPVLVQGETDSSPAIYTNITYVTYTVVQVQPLFYIKKYLGAVGQAAAPELMAAAAAAGIPSAWDGARKGTGLCYLTCVVEADFNILGQIGIPNLSAVVRGVKAYDPRTGLTVWTQNPAVLSRWFQVDSGFAPQTLSSEIHAGELLASANVCDEGVYFSAARYEARYTCNGQLTTAASPLDNLNHILDSMDGDAVWISGQWQIVAGYYKTPTLEIDENTLSSAGITVAPRTAKRDLFNGISGTFVNPAAGYVRMGYSMVTSTVYQVEDGGELLPADVSFELVNDPIRCQMIAWQRLTRARQPLTLQLGTTLKGYDSAPLQTVNVNLARLGYVNKVFTNLRREFENNTLLYILQETGPAVWAWSYANANAAVDIPNTSFPDVASIPMVEGIEYYSGTDALQLLGDGTVISRARLRWTRTTNTYVLQGGKVEWQHKQATVLTDDWTLLVPASGDDTEIFTGPLVDGDLMHVRARYVTGQGRRGDWCPIISFTVIGKTEKPPNIDDLSISGIELSWTLSGVADSKGYVFRFHYGSNFDWGTAAPLHAGYITSSPFILSARPSGLVTIMGKEVDRSDNESVKTGNVVVNLGDAPVANVVEIFDLHAEGYPGDVTGGALDGGDLLADDTNSFYGPGPQSFYGQGSEPFFKLASYAQMVYTSREISIVSALAGSIATLQLESAGTDLTVEYRRSGPGSFYGAYAEPFYGEGPASFYGPPGVWVPWPGQLVVDNDVYQLRITVGAGAEQGALTACALIVDAPDIVEYIEDVPLAIGGTVPPYTKPFTVIKTVTPSLQAFASGATGIVIDKSNNLAPLFTPVNGITPVAGASADFIIKGY